MVYKYRKWVWIALLVLSVPTGWISSTVFVSALSILALYLTDSAGEQAADTSITQKKQIEQGDEELDQKKLDKKDANKVK